MTRIDFYTLSRAIQDGLLDAFRGQFTPAPLIHRPGTRRLVVVWAAVSAASAAGLAALCAVGFGEVSSPVGLQPVPVAAAYVALAATYVFGVIRALACVSERKALPFKPALYLFPACLIDARDHRLRVHPLAELASVSAGAGGAVVLRWKGSSFSFPLADPSQIPALVQAVETARDMMRTNPDASTRRRLDPLEPPVVQSPLSSPIALSRRVPWWQRYGWLVAGAVGVATGGGLYFLRNRTSDDRMFATARARDDVPSYKAYLVRGRRHVDEAARVLLPRAELRLAVADGSVEAIDAFRRAYPETGIQAEVDAARHKALVAALERARAAGTLAALLAFADRYPQHGVDKAFNEARHALYVRAFERYKAQIPKGSNAYAELVGRLLTYAERVGPTKTPDGLRGPAVEIRFQRMPSQDLKRAEELVTRSPMYAGVTSLPTRYTTAENLDPHEKSAAQALADALGAGFAPDLVTFVPGPRIEGTGDAPLAVKSPTLAVSYRVEASGAAHARKMPRGIYLGLMFLFKADFLLPGDDKPFSVKHRIVERIPMDILNEHKDAVPPGTVETKVYAAMMGDAFVDFNARYLSKWFVPRKGAK